MIEFYLYWFRWRRTRPFFLSHFLSSIVLDLFFESPEALRVFLPVAINDNSDVSGSAKENI